MIRLKENKKNEGIFARREIAAPPSLKNKVRWIFVDVPSLHHYLEWFRPSMNQFRGFVKQHLPRLQGHFSPYAVKSDHFQQPWIGYVDLSG
jgi:hypothetical protein